MPRIRVFGDRASSAAKTTPRRVRNPATAGATITALATGRPSRSIVPVLCRFWHEDGVWNGIAQETAVAVFGNSFEEARENLRSALESHFDSAEETGQVEQVLACLVERARDYRFLSLDEIAPDSAIVKMQVARKGEAWVASA